MGCDLGKGNMVIFLQILEYELFHGIIEQFIAIDFQPSP